MPKEDSVCPMMPPCTRSSSATILQAWLGYIYRRSLPPSTVLLMLSQTTKLRSCQPTRTDLYLQSLYPDTTLHALCIKGALQQHNQVRTHLISPRLHPATPG